MISYFQINSSLRQLYTSVTRRHFSSIGGYGMINIGMAWATNKNAFGLLVIVITMVIPGRDYKE